MLDGYVGSTIAFLPTAWAGRILKWTEDGDDLEGPIVTIIVGALKGFLVGGRSLEYVLTTSDHWELDGAAAAENRAGTRLKGSSKPPKNPRKSLVRRKP